ncbi:MAG: desulfoferrodoxin [Patescibacteria group bacterium]|jgi:superoxide reductase
MKLNEIYKCSVCGNIVEVVHVGGGVLVCCGQDMILQTENSVDASLEKHVPVIEKTETGVKVKIGATLHPMEEVHYIEWIEIIVDPPTGASAQAGGRVDRRYLKPGDAPEAEFNRSGENITARAYCNLHGLWKK